MSKRRTVIVVGATGGIGSVIVEFLVKAEFNVVLFSRTLEKLVTLAKLYPTDRVLVVAGDATSNKDVKGVFQKTRKRFGQVDGVVISAGTWKRLHLNHSLNKFRRSQDEAYYSLYLPTAIVSHEAQQAFRKQNRGLIVNISSHVVLRNDLSGNLSYSPMKTAGHKLILDLAHEFKHTKGCRVRATGIAPAIVDTPENRKLLKTEKNRTLAVQPQAIARWIVKTFDVKDPPSSKHFPAKKGLKVA